jgi:hypothetical protein
MTERTKINSGIASLALAGMITFPVDGQTPKSKPTDAKAKAARAKAYQAAVAAAARKLRALQLIDEVLADAKMVGDLESRAMFQARAADALWKADPERARAIFRVAWETATAADSPVERSTGSEIGSAKSENYDEDWFVRSRVLSIVARRDRALADKFISELATPDDSETDAQDQRNDQNPDNPWRSVSPRGIFRLSLAREQLAAGDPSRAAQFAEPVIAEGASGELLAFLLELWAADAASAERLYVDLISVVRGNQRAGANDVLLLSTPVISPQLMLVVDRSGALQFRPAPPSTTPIRVTALAWQIFFATAGEILLRPLAPVGTSGITPDAIARYVAGERLLPFLDREAPQLAAALRLRNASLANEIDPARATGLAGQIAKTSYPVNRTGDPLSTQMDELGKAKDAAERDRIALGMVVVAARRRFWDRAKTVAAEITDPEMRRAALSFIQLNQIEDLTRATTDDHESDLTGLTAFVRRADVPPLATAWGLAQLALTARRMNKPSLSMALFTEALSYAGKTESGSGDRLAAYAMGARLMLVNDAKRAWTVIPEIVQSANAMDDEPDREFAGIRPNGSLADEHDELIVTADVFDVDRLFAALARLDFDRAGDAARSFGLRSARINAELAVATVELNR